MSNIAQDIFYTKTLDFKFEDGILLQRNVKHTIKWEQGWRDPVEKSRKEEDVWLAVEGQ